MSESRDTFSRATLLAELTIDEGKRHLPYLDTMGLVTIGIGRNLSGNGLSDEEIAHLFDNDIQACVDLLDQHIAWWRDLAPNEQRVMINLTFNMGWIRFAAFGHFLDAMKSVAALHKHGVSDPVSMGNALAYASHQLEDSRWFTQVGLRGPRIVKRLMGSAPADPSATV